MGLCRFRNGIDLFGERLLLLILTGDTRPPVEDWTQKLIGFQNDDGSWGIDNSQEDHYFRYHAILVAAWVLSIRQEESHLE